MNTEPVDHSLDGGNSDGEDEVEGSRWEALAPLWDFVHDVFVRLVEVPLMEVANALNRVSLPTEVITLGWWRVHGKWAVPSLLISIVGLVGAGVSYRSLKHRRMVSMTVSAMAQGDLDSATLGAFMLLKANPNELLACKTLAAIADTRHFSDALAWHRRVIELDPNDGENQWASVRIALRAKRIWIARELLAAVPSSLIDQAEYHHLLGEVLKSDGRFAEAEEHLRTALRLNPQSAAIAFGLNEIRLHLPQQADEARIALQKLSSIPEFRLEALRALTEDAARRAEFGVAVDFARAGEQESAAAPEDFIKTLNLLHLVKASAFPEALAACQARALQNPRSVAELAFWMNDAGLPILAIDWVRSLPRELQKDPYVLFALATSHFAVSDWTALEGVVDRGQWDACEPLRLALLAFCERKAGGKQLWKKHLDEAYQKGATDPQIAALLYQMVSGWGTSWREGLDEFVWGTLEQSAPSIALVRTLQSRFSSAGETRNLHRLFARILAVDPSRREAQNDFAACSLLLGENVEQARNIALSLHRSDERDPRWAQTYAFSLYTEGRFNEAIEIVSRYPEALADPTFAVYSGIFLAAAGRNWEKVEKLLDSAPQADLLPEEAALVNDARIRLERRKTNDGRQTGRSDVTGGLADGRSRMQR